MVLQIMNERASIAIARIERAIERIATLELVVKDNPQTALVAAKIESRHQTLKRETQSALADLDALINHVRST